MEITQIILALLPEVSPTEKLTVWNYSIISNTESYDMEIYIQDLLKLGLTQQQIVNHFDQWTKENV